MADADTEKAPDITVNMPPLPKPLEVLLTKVAEHPILTLLTMIGAAKSGTVASLAGDGTAQAWELFKENAEMLRERAEIVQHRWTQPGAKAKRYLFAAAYVALLLLTCGLRAVGVGTALIGGIPAFVLPLLMLAPPVAELIVLAIWGLETVDAVQGPVGFVIGRLRNSLRGRGAIAWNDERKAWKVVDTAAVRRGVRGTILHLLIAHILLVQVCLFFGFSGFGSLLFIGLCVAGMMVVAALKGYDLETGYRITLKFEAIMAVTVAAIGFVQFLDTKLSAWLIGEPNSFGAKVYEILAVRGLSGTIRGVLCGDTAWSLMNGGSWEQRISDGLTVSVIFLFVGIVSWTVLKIVFGKIVRRGEVPQSAPVAKPVGGSLALAGWMFVLAIFAKLAGAGLALLGYPVVALWLTLAAILAGTVATVAFIASLSGPPRWILGIGYALAAVVGIYLAGVVTGSMGETALAAHAAAPAATEIAKPAPAPTALAATTPAATAAPQAPVPARRASAGKQGNGKASTQQAGDEDPAIGILDEGAKRFPLKREKCWPNGCS